MEGKKRGERRKKEGRERGKRREGGEERERRRKEERRVRRLPIEERVFSVPPPETGTRDDDVGTAARALASRNNQYSSVQAAYPKQTNALHRNTPLLFFQVRDGRRRDTSGDHVATRRPSSLR